MMRREGDLAFKDQCFILECKAQMAYALGLVAKGHSLINTGSFPSSPILLQDLCMCSEDMAVEIRLEPFRSPAIEREIYPTSPLTYCGTST